MKPVDYYRQLAARLRAVDGAGNELREDAASALCNAASIIDEQAKREKARSGRIQWVYCGERTMVARYKGDTYRYSGTHRRVDRDTKTGWVEILEATSIENASRKIRAWRKKQ